MNFEIETTQESLKSTDLRVKIFADGADYDSMLASYANPLVAGFTTNPTLMTRAGVQDYIGFAKDIVQAIPDRDISFDLDKLLYI